MGNNAACCAVKDSEADKQATTLADELRRAEAVPVVDAALDRVPVQKQAAGASTPPAGGASGAGSAEPKPKADAPDASNGLYKVTLDKAQAGKLGLDVDYMAERMVLPIMAITGGLAEVWNNSNPNAVLQKGDSIIEVNGTRENVTLMLEKCKNEKVLQLVLARSLTYDHLLGDLEELVKSKQCGPLLIRLSWHDAGVFMEGGGGCPNAAMRFTEAGEAKFAANAGLPTVALSLLAPISSKYCPSLISHSDLWVLAANVAIKHMGGPDVPTRYGRPDAKSHAEGVSSADGRLPEADKGADHLRAIFRPKGFDDKAIVALSGAHTVGRCHLDRSGFDGPWTDTPLKFNNDYFKDLLSRTYTPETTAKGCPQFRHAASGTMMLPTDMALVKDAAFKKYVEAYAKDQQVFFADFTKAWTKLQESGCDNLRDIL